MLIGQCHCWLHKTKWGQSSVTKSNDLTPSLQEEEKTVELNYIHEKEQKPRRGAEEIHGVKVSRLRWDKEATDLVTDLVRMGYFFRRRRYCCNSRIWIAASRIGRLSTGIVHRLSVCLARPRRSWREPSSGHAAAISSCRRHCMIARTTPPGWNTTGVVSRSEPLVWKRRRLSRERAQNVAKHKKWITETTNSYLCWDGMSS